MSEQWRSVPGYEGLYAVSDLGNVMSMDYKGSGLPGLLKPLTGAKYPRVALCRNGHERGFQIHSLVMLAFVGPRPEGLCVNHKDGNKKNNALSNLEYCTYSENNRHALRTGLRVLPSGDGHWNAKLSEDAVTQIRERLANGEKHKTIAADFGVGQSTISSINIGRIRPINTDQSQAKNLRLVG